MTQSGDYTVAVGAGPLDLCALGAGACDRQRLEGIYASTLGAYIAGVGDLSRGSGPAYMAQCPA